MSVDGFKLDGEHRVGCFSEHDADGMTFIVYDKNVYRDKLGRRSASNHLWLAFRCNDPQCVARMLVRWDVLSRFVSGQGLN